jgi:hypothetical protein
MNEPLKKTPPKSSDRIRAALESVRRDVDHEVAAGPYREGLDGDTRFVVAAFHQPEAARRFQEVLLRAGIMSEGAFHRNGAEISIDYSDCQRAAELLERHLAEFPDRPVHSLRREFDYTIFGALLGCTFGLTLAWGEMEGPRLALVLLVFTLFGATSGFFFDGPRNRYRHTGSLQFGVGDLLALMSVIALGFFIWRLLWGR